MIEDAEERHLVHIWSWITIFGVSTSFFTPLGGWFVSRFGLVPSMRGILLFGFIMLTAKAIILYVYSHETDRGVRRLEETHGRSLLALLGEYRQVVPQLVRSRPIRIALSLMLVTSIYNTINGSFWGVLFTSKSGLPEAYLSLFAALGSIVTAACMFLIGPRMRSLAHFRLPLWLGFGLYLASQALLVLMPTGAVPLLVASVMLAAVAAALVSPMIESLLAVALDSHERARVSAMVYMTLILFTTPFGWIAGQLSAIDRSLPFAFNMVLFMVGALLVWLIGRWRPTLADVES
jgi:Na+/melibiose symporter-like transporter